MVLVADGDVTRFVVLGDRYADGRAPGPIAVTAGDGYDGQFAYRLALDPADSRSSAHGIVLDGPLRVGRIGYPVLAWLVALGRAAWVPWALVLVNVLGVGLLGLLGGWLARDAGRRVLTGLLLAGWGGFAFAVARDLTEVVAAVGVVAGLLAYRRERPVLAGAALVGAVLSRESALIVPAALGLCWLAGAARSGVPARWRARSGLPAWLLPAVAFLAWQAVCWRRTGDVPVLASLGSNIGEPSVGSGLSGSGAAPGSISDGRALATSALKYGQFALLAAAVLLVAVRLRRLCAPAHELVALALAVAVSIRVLPLVWNDWACFRAFSDVWVLAVVPLVGSSVRLRWLPTASGLVTAAAAGMLVLVL